MLQRSSAKRGTEERLLFPWPAISAFSLRFLMFCTHLLLRRNQLLDELRKKEAQDGRFLLRRFVRWVGAGILEHPLAECRNISPGA